MVKQKRFKGDKYRPVAKVLKMHGTTPSVLEISGSRYILDASADHRRNRRKQYENRTGHAAAVKKRREKVE